VHPRNICQQVGVSLTNIVMDWFSGIAAERRRREEGWTDLGLDQLDRNGGLNSIPPRVPTQQG
jgi:hypothetical protein